MVLTSRKFLAYQLDAFMRAWHETWDWSPVNPKQAIFTIFVFVAIWYVAVQFGAQEELTTPFFIITVVVPLAVGAAFFISQRFMAPARILTELETERDQLENKLKLLNTPCVALDLYREIQESIEGVQTAFLEVTGQSARKVRVEVFGTDVRANTPTGHDTYGKFILYMASTVPNTFSVHRGETYRSMPVIRYNPREVGPAIHIEIPVQIPTTDIIRGNEFMLTIAAFGGTQPAVMAIRFGVDCDTRRLWVQKEGSTERLASRALEASPIQIDEQFDKGFETA